MDDPIEPTDGGGTVSALRSYAREFAQLVLEFFHPQIWVRAWPPSIRADESGMRARVAAVRAGTRKIGVDRTPDWFDNLIAELDKQRAERRKERGRG